MSDHTPDETAGEQWLQWWREGEGGNREAKARFHEAVRPFLRAVLQTYAPNQTFGAWDASDAVQDCCLILDTLAVDQFRGTTGGEFLSWLRSIALNKYRDKIREGKAQKRGGARTIVSLPAGRDGEEVLAADASTPSQHAAQREEQDEVEAALSRLPADDQQLIRLWRSPEKLTWAQIAEKMNRSEDAVKQLFRRATLRWTKERGKK